MPSIVSTQNLTRAYASRTALDNLTLDVNPGEIFAFLGPNGSGKTTLFRILSTLFPPTAGDVVFRFSGSEFRLKTSELSSIRPHLGVVFQSPSLDNQLTAEENLRHHGHLYGLRGAALASRIDEMLGRVNLLDRKGDRVGTFSGGMRRRVEIAKGLLTSPSLLLLDEPSTGLDPGSRIDLWNTLRAVNADGVTVLLTTHLMEEADLCSRLAILDQGKLIACDTPANLKSQIGGDVVTLSTGTPEAAAVAAQEIQRQFSLSATHPTPTTLRIEHPDGPQLIPRLVAALPGVLMSITTAKPTLLDVFVHLTGRTFETETAPKPAAARH